MVEKGREHWEQKVKLSLKEKKYKPSSKRGKQ